MNDQPKTRRGLRTAAKGEPGGTGRKPTQKPQHSTYMGHRGVRRADGGSGQLFFARCQCGWEGPSRIERSEAVNDGFGHLQDGDQS